MTVIMFSLQLITTPFCYDSAQIDQRINQHSSLLLFACAKAIVAPNVTRLRGSV